MEKKQLIKFGNSIYRVLAIQNEEALLIDCIKRNMPKWKHISEIGNYIACDEKELLQVTETVLEDIENLDAESRSTAYQRYTIVASILPFLDNDCLRTEAIKRASEDNKICKQTVRNYLCLYLAFQSVSALVPEQRGTYQKKLTDDEKVFRWAINKYYFTAHKNSLKTCFTYMLKEKYCNADGTLVTDYPSYNQFRYYFSKYKKMQTFYISRNGMKDYQRNHRPLLGDKMQEYSNHIGIGEIDATICDIHLETLYQCSNGVIGLVLSLIMESQRLKELYHRRWSIESSFRKLKYTIGLSNYHSYKPEYVKQEIWANLLHVFSSHLHMDEQTPHIHIDFVPFIRNSKRGLDTRVSLKGALSEQGFKGGTRGMTEWNQWIESEKQELSKVIGRHGVQWKQLGTHNKHLSVLDFEKQERQKEVAELEQTICGSKEELSSILHQQTAAEQETEQIRKEGETIRQEVSELSATNHLLKEQMETLTENKEKLLSENEKLEKQQKKLQQELNKMVQSKEVM